ncbi:MAG: hypothetical protein QM324_07195, partial [Bacteroidota bacterium]|nr:hypothetical protein [Bacteroidota bacterium]
EGKISQVERHGRLRKARQVKRLHRRVIRVVLRNRQRQAAQMAGETLESLVVARRVYNAMVRKAELGQADLRQFPMLCHAAAVLDQGKDAELPWELFTFDQTK